MRSFASLLIGLALGGCPATNEQRQSSPPARLPGTQPAGSAEPPLPTPGQRTRASTQSASPPLPNPLPPEEPPSFPSPSAEFPPETQQRPRLRRAYRVAALGDSITDERVGGGGYLRFLRRACPQSTFENFGRGGDMTNQMHRRFRTDLLPAHQKAPFDTLIVFGGVNDLYSDLSAGRTNDKIEAELSAIYAEGKAVGLQIVAVTVSPWGGFTSYFNPRRGQNTRLLNSWILGGPAERRVDAVVDAYALLSCGDPQRLCPAYQGARPDGLHPGPGGHERLGAAFFEVAFPDCQ